MSDITDLPGQPSLPPWRGASPTRRRFLQSCSVLALSGGVTVAALVIDPWDDGSIWDDGTGWTR